MGNKPSLVIEGGARKFDGNGGNEYFTFRNGRFTYVVWNTVLGNGTGLRVEVQRDGKVLSSDEKIP